MQTDTHPALTTAPWTRRDAVAAIVLALLAFGIYANSIPNEFVYDDHTVVVQDTRSHGLSRIDKLFSQGYWTITKRPLYRPITLLSLAVNHAVTGLSAPGYRVVNLLLHALVCIGVYRLTLLVFGRFWTALVAGLVYAVHPIHVEAVVPIVGRSELLAALAVVVALALYVGDAARGGRGVTWRYVLIVALTWTAMLCKESAIVLIGMVVAFDAWRRYREPTRPIGWGNYFTSRFIWRYAGMIFAVLIVFSMRQYAIGTLFGEGITFPLVDNPLGRDPLWVRALTGFVLLGKYAQLLLIGHPLCCDYSYDAIPVARSITPAVLMGAVCLAGVLVTAVVSLRRRGETALGVCWFLVAYAPVANVVVLIGTFLAERLMYLPSIAVAMVWGVVVSGAVERCRKRGSAGFQLLAACLTVATVIGLGAYGVLTVRRNAIWRNDESLYRDGLAKQPDSARCQFNMGSWYASHGEMDKGIEHLRRAVEIADSYVMGRTKLGYCYLCQSRWQDAVDVLKPLVASTTSRSEHLISPLQMMGRAHLEMGNLDAAIGSFRRVLEIDPKNAEAKRCVAEIVTRPEVGGNLYSPLEGWGLIVEAVNLEPNDVVYLASAARIALRQHRLLEAKTYLARATEIANERIRQANAGKLDRAATRTVRLMARDLTRMRDDLREQMEERIRRLRGEATQPSGTSSTSNATSTWRADGSD
ncbi:MAG: tetratricopeptide repeat protein [Phycisphaerae bacterium]|nr:tetratricopeptide repeat protein [Phycisphaerae bacterium]